MSVPNVFVQSFRENSFQLVALLYSTMFSRFKELCVMYFCCASATSVSLLTQEDCVDAASLPKVICSQQGLPDKLHTNEKLKKKRDREGEREGETESHIQLLFPLDTSSVEVLINAWQQISSMPGCDVRPVRKSSTGKEGSGSIFSSHPVGPPS